MSRYVVIIINRVALKMSSRRRLSTYLTNALPRGVDTFAASTAGLTPDSVASRMKSTTTLLVTEGSRVDVDRRGQQPAA